jgi:membrane protein
MNKKNLLSHYQKYGDGVGIFIILFSAGLVFRELRRSFNLIFQIRNVQTRVLSTGQLVVRFIKRELFPYVAVLLFIMLLLVYLTSSSSIVSLIPFDYRPKWFLYQNVVAFLFFTFIFAVLFRYSPDQKTSWFQSFVGGIVTTLFCMLGTHFVGVYMAKHFVFNFFGIFGPLFLFLIWVYYSYFMILFGAIVCAAL